MRQTNKRDGQGQGQRGRHDDDGAWQKAGNATCFEGETQPAPALVTLMLLPCAPTIVRVGDYDGKVCHTGHHWPLIAGRLGRDGSFPSSNPFLPSPLAGSGDGNTVVYPIAITLAHGQRESWMALPPVRPPTFRRVPLLSHPQTRWLATQPASKQRQSQAMDAPIHAAASCRRPIRLTESMTLAGTSRPTVTPCRHLRLQTWPG